jgi:hypothetical protein
VGLHVPPHAFDTLLNVLVSARIPVAKPSQGAAWKMCSSWKGGKGGPTLERHHVSTCRCIDQKAVVPTATTTLTHHPPSQTSANIWVTTHLLKNPTHLLNNPTH